MKTNLFRTRNEVIKVKSNVVTFDFNLDWKNCIISEYKLAMQKREEGYDLLCHVGYDEDEWYKD